MVGLMRYIFFVFFKFLLLGCYILKLEKKSNILGDIEICIEK